MRITVERYNPEWVSRFEKIKADLLKLIGFLNPRIEHIGSTAVEGLSAKPIVDVLIGLECENDLDKVVLPLMNNDYVYYEIYNQYLPDRRFFVKHKVSPQVLSLPRIFKDHDKVPADTFEHDNRLAHIHVWTWRSEHWTRHIAFRDYLRAHPVVRQQYQQLKELLSQKEWIDGNEYNEAKDLFLKTEEKRAVDWYLNR